MLPFPSSFLRDLLAVPHERIAYEAGLRIAALRPGRAVLETDSSAFDFAEALERGAVDGRLVDMVPAQCLRRYYEATELSELVIENAIHACAFEGCVVEVVTVTFLAGDCTETRHWVVAPDADIADRFFMRVCVLVKIVADVKGFFDASALYARYRIPHKRGILLYGPPGNGKTHFLKGLLATVEVPCLYVKSLVNHHRNDHDALRRIFVRARSVAPCLLVLEDLETIVGDDNRSFFLNELDGFSENTGVAVLATTNYPERIDPAIIDRPSRFDRKYLFDLPSTDERLAYLERWARGLEAELRSLSMVTVSWIMACSRAV